MPLAARRNAGSYKGTVEGAAPLLQLPHLDTEVSRRLARKRVKGVADLQAKGPEDLHTTLEEAGLDPQHVR